MELSNLFFLYLILQVALVASGKNVFDANDYKNTKWYDKIIRNRNEKRCGNFDQPDSDGDSGITYEDSEPSIEPNSSPETYGLSEEDNSDWFSRRNKRETWKKRDEDSKEEYLGNNSIEEEEAQKNKRTGNDSQLIPGNSSDDETTDSVRSRLKSLANISVTTDNSSLSRSKNPYSIPQKIPDVNEAIDKPQNTIISLENSTESELQEYNQNSNLEKKKDFNKKDKKKIVGSGKNETSNKQEKESHRTTEDQNQLKNEGIRNENKQYMGQKTSGNITSTSDEEINNIKLKNNDEDTLPKGRMNSKYDDKYSQNSVEYQGAEKQRVIDIYEDEGYLVEEKTSTKVNDQENAKKSKLQINPPTIISKDNSEPGSLYDQTTYSVGDGTTITVDDTSIESSIGKPPKAIANRYIGDEKVQVAIKEKKEPNRPNEESISNSIPPSDNQESDKKSESKKSSKNGLKNSTAIVFEKISMGEKNDKRYVYPSKQDVPNNNYEKVPSISLDTSYKKDKTSSSIEDSIEDNTKENKRNEGKIKNNTHEVKLKGENDFEAIKTEDTKEYSEAAFNKEVEISADSSKYSEEEFRSNNLPKQKLSENSKWNFEIDEVDPFSSSTGDLSSTNPNKESSSNEDVASDENKKSGEEESSDDDSIEIDSLAYEEVTKNPKVVSPGQSEPPNLYSHEEESTNGRGESENFKYRQPNGAEYGDSDNIKAFQGQVVEGKQGSISEKNRSNNLDVLSNYPSERSNRIQPNSSPNLLDGSRNYFDNPMKMSDNVNTITRRRPVWTEMGTRKRLPMDSFVDFRQSSPIYHQDELVVLSSWMITLMKKIPVERYYLERCGITFITANYALTCKYHCLIWTLTNGKAYLYIPPDCEIKSPNLYSFFS